LQPKISEIIKR